MCPFVSIVCLGVQLDNLAFNQFWNNLLLFSGFMFNIRSFFTIVHKGTLDFFQSVPNSLSCHMNIYMLFEMAIKQLHSFVHCMRISARLSVLWIKI